MRSLWLGILACAAMFVACGDDNSDFATRPSDDSSSSVCKDCDDGSSSSAKSSSSPVKSSSSIKSSSSSAKSSSSSVTLAIPCKTDSTDTCEYGELVDDRDGQIYKTVKIGDQVWMAENLNYAYLQPTDELDSSSFCYNDSAEYCEKYGRLYLWSAAMDSVGTWSSNGKGCGYDVACSPTYPVRGVCPEGWHLPDTTEWRTLLTAVGGYLSAGTKLKTASGWLSDDLGTDNFGFSALGVGSGARIDYGYEGSLAYFHSSVECDDDIEQNKAYKNDFAYEVILTPFETALLEKEVEFEGFSVRCVKD
ncbi:fibrobacter succinogenes major paralogous domain-containing protein [Fibrobacter succinogenes]|uniref:fibrobacter succinogenes major paralogous domain-containing protein n=1 Tax=Fibrobacter succinogenes TaxID=833 RepID=UPI0026F1C30B|nr:fibrobacter succinogenes major paralogous domain-containing protein [Fibrobacter succinogenes]